MRNSAPDLKSGQRELPRKRSSLFLPILERKIVLENASVNEIVGKVIGRRILTTGLGH